MYLDAYDAAVLWFWAKMLSTHYASLRGRVQRDRIITEIDLEAEEQGGWKLRQEAAR